MIKKILFFFAWVGIFILSVLGLGYILFPNLFVDFDINSLTFKVIVFNICLIYICLSILKLVSNFYKDKDYIIKTEHGKINISTETIKNFIKEILSKDSDIKGVKVVCKSRRNKQDIKLTLDMVSVDLSSKTFEIQQLVKKNLEEKLDLKINSIEIKIEKLSIRKDAKI